MELNDEQKAVLAWLKALAALGVVKYEWSPQTGLRVEFGPSVATADGPIVSNSRGNSQRPSVVKHAKNIWENPGLWGGGDPPKFHKDE